MPPTITPSPTPAPASGTVTVQVGASSDDMYETSGSANLTSETFPIGGASTYYAGMRFTNVTVPQGATITDAYVEVYMPSGQWIQVDYDIYAEDTADSSTFTTANSAGDRPGTSAVANYSSSENWSSGWHELEHVTAAVQEVVDRNDWSAGNALAIILNGTGGQWGRKFVTSYNGSPANAPRLVIEYTSSSPATNTPVPTATNTNTAVPTNTLSPTATNTAVPAPTETPRLPGCAPTTTGRPRHSGWSRCSTDAKKASMSASVTEAKGTLCCSR